MAESYLQTEFLRVFAQGHRATANHIISRLMAAGVPAELEARVTEIVRDELRGLYHGNLVVFDNGTSLADQGMIKIVDDQGTPFIGYLHEIGFRVYDEPT